MERNETDWSQFLDWQRRDEKREQDMREQEEDAEEKDRDEKYKPQSKFMFFLTLR